MQGSRCGPLGSPLPYGNSKCQITDLTEKYHNAPVKLKYGVPRRDLMGRPRD